MYESYKIYFAFHNTFDFTMIVNKLCKKLNKQTFNASYGTKLFQTKKLH